MANSGTGREWKHLLPQYGNGKGMKKHHPIIREREGNKRNIPEILKREWNEKFIPIIWERESEPFILGNGREREFPLTPVLSGNSEIPLRVKDFVCWPRIHMTQPDFKFHWWPCVWIEQSPCPVPQEHSWYMEGYKQLLIFIFIGPESDHWQCLSVTDSLTHWLTAV